MLERYDPRRWAISTRDVLELAIGLAIPILLALAIHWVVFAVVRRIVRASHTQIDDAIVEAVRKPARWAIIAIAVAIAANLNPQLGAGWALFANYLVPALLGWVAYAVVDGFTGGLELEAEASEDAVT